MRLVPLVLLLALLAGCRTAKGVYTDGMGLETSGQQEAAALAYADALRRDPAIPNAAGRLGVAGSMAVRQRLAAAAAATTPARAADDMIAAEALVRAASGVGVGLERPASFDADVARACAEAVDDLLDQGRARADADDFRGALALYDRARGYRPSRERQADLDGGARDAYAEWAQADLVAGRFRAGLEHADAALGLAAPGSEIASTLQALRAEVVDAGTVVAAVFPATVPRRPTGDALPRGFLQDVSEVLLDDRLAPPPLFVALVDPAEARRALRLSRDDLAGNPRLLGNLARDLRADLGLVAEVDGFAMTEAEASRRDVTFRIRAGGTAPAVRVTTRMTLSVRAALVAVDADGRRVACASGSPVSVSADYGTATTTADVAGLRLSADERDLFTDTPRDDAYARLVDDLADRLAEALAARVSACVGARVP